MIPDNIAVFKRSNNDDSLAYMCDSKKNNMRKTGASWSGNDTPLELANSPLHGFKIIASVSRYRTDNKLWRVQDPRGFVLEITTGNLEGIIADCDIVGGVIQGTCVWGRYGSVTLLPIRSALYKEERSKTDIQQSEVIKAKDLIIGATYKLKNGDQAVYFGKSHRVSFPRDNYVYEAKIPKAKSHFYEVGTSLYVSTSTFQALERVGNHIDNATLEAVVRRNKYVASYSLTFLLESAVCSNYTVGLRTSTLEEQSSEFMNRFKAKDEKFLTGNEYAGSEFGTYFLAESDRRMQMWCMHRETKTNYIEGRHKALPVTYRPINYNYRASITNFQDLQRGTAKNIEIEMTRYSYQQNSIVGAGVVYVPTITINGQTRDLLRNR